MISTSPVSTKKKAELISLKTAGARYGLEITQPSNEVAKAFDNQLMYIIGGQNKIKSQMLGDHHRSAMAKS